MRLPESSRHLSLAALLCCFASPAWADEQPSTAPAQAPSKEAANEPPAQGILAQEILAPKKAFEIGIEGGYIQPFGNIDPSRPIGGYADAGGGVGLTLSYRYHPHWSIGLAGQFHASSPDATLASGTRVYGIAGDLLATYHFLPMRFVDPVLAFGGGYRAMFVSGSGGTPSERIHGLEPAAVRFGVDFRITKDIAFGPEIGADVNFFLFDGMQAASFFIQSTRPVTFIHAGVAARFDIGGSRVEKRALVAHE